MPEVVRVVAYEYSSSSVVLVPVDLIARSSTSVRRMTRRRSTTEIYTCVLSHNPDRLDRKGKEKEVVCVWRGRTTERASTVISVSTSTRTHPQLQRRRGDADDQFLAVVHRREERKAPVRRHLLRARPPWVCRDPFLDDWTWGRRLTPHGTLDPEREVGPENRPERDIESCECQRGIDPCGTPRTVMIRKRGIEPCEMRTTV